MRSLAPTSCRLKKKTPQCESCELFYLGQNEGYSPGESISESFEKLLQRGMVGGGGGGGGTVNIDVILVKGEIHAIKDIFLQKVTVSHEEQTSP